MRAWVRIAVGAKVPKEEQHLRDLTQYEKLTIFGDEVPDTGNVAADLKAAKAAVTIPEDAVVLGWYSTNVHDPAPFA